MDRNESEPAKASISRRDALKKGAVIGGTVLWVTPVVQTIGMTGAFAQTTSGTGPPGTTPKTTPNTTPPTTTDDGPHDPRFATAPPPNVASPPDDNLASNTMSGLATTGSNSQRVAELGVAATALGAGMVAISRVKKSHQAEPVDEGPAPV